jgi:DNA repair exonuclease SbcCD ATPase subunit
MKRSLLYLIVFAVCSIFLTSESAVAQSNVARPTSEQSLQELVAEVRQLRGTLQRMNAAVYKGQVMLERLKLQQEQVTRISRELTEVRESVNEVRSQQLRIKELLNRAEAGVEVGMKHPTELAGIKAEMEAIGQREQRLAMRETQLANDLEVERAKLNDLNDRLNALVEIEMAPK